MKKNSFSILVLLWLSILSSCTSVLEVNINNIKPKITLNCVLSTDSAIIVHLNASTEINQTNNSVIDATNAGSLFPPIENAQVLVYEDGKLLSQLTELSRGVYIDSLHTPQAGKIYKIVVKSTDFQEVEATDTVPPNLVYIDKKITPDYKTDFKGPYFFNFVIQNNPQIPHYFYSSLKMRMITKLPNESLPRIQEYYDAINFESQIADYTTVNNNTGIIFSNKGLKQMEEEFSVPFYIMVDNYSKVLVFYNFGSCSTAYFLFAKSYEQYKTDDNYFSEKPPVFSNIKNGYGILMSRNIRQDTLVYFN